MTDLWNDIWPWLLIAGAIIVGYKQLVPLQWIIVAGIVVGVAKVALR